MRVQAVAQAPPCQGGKILLSIFRAVQISFILFVMFIKSVCLFQGDGEWQLWQKCFRFVCRSPFYFLLRNLPDSLSLVNRFFHAVCEGLKCLFACRVHPHFQRYRQFQHTVSIYIYTCIISICTCTIYTHTYKHLHKGYSSLFKCLLWPHSV